MNFFISISPPAFPPSLPTAAANPSGIVDSRIPWLIVTFRAFPCILSDLLSPTAPTFSVWVLGALWHEQQAWTRYLYSQRDDPAKYAYAQDQLPDTAVLLDGPDSIKRRWERIVGLPFGQRASAVSCLIYGKTYEIRYHAKEMGWFRDLWLAQRGEDGLPTWDGEAPVWRVEFRFKRQALAEFGIEDVCDLIEHVNDLWMYAAGHVSGGDDGLPDGWLRYVVPVNDLNRSRWPVHPAWRAIQGACVAVLVRPGEPVPSAPAAIDLEPFIRRRKREVNLQRALAAVAGYVSTIEAWRPVLDGGGSDQTIEPDISDTFHFVFENVTGYLDEKERDFSQLVHKKRMLYRLETQAA